MIKIHVLLATALAAVTITGEAQTVKMGMKNTATTVSVPHVTVDNETHDLVYVRMGYAGWQIENPEVLQRIEGRPIEQVKLCYTDFPPGKDHSDLNRKRIASLYIEAPNIFEQRYAEWQMVQQTAPASEWEATRMFHGFIIRFRPEGTAATAHDETAYIRRYLEATDTPRPDSTVLKVMARNADWKDMMIVADLTGSMSPYAAQLLLWLKLTLDDAKAHYLVFFNDGDMRPDMDKRPGSTGGIYSAKVNGLENALALAERTMTGGYGGDNPENNIEALLHGTARWNDFREVVMIADNFATPRDMELLKDVKVPVRVVLCGTHAGINPAYLQIARETGGSLHTMEEDIVDLIQLKEGSKVTIGRENFLIQKGRFVLISSS